MAYLTTAQVRALPDLSDPAKFPDAQITTTVTWFETTFEGYTGVAWETRSVVDERHYLTSSRTIILDHMMPRSITALRVYSTASTSTPYTAAELADLRLDSSGVIRRVSLGHFTSGYGLMALDYTHAATATPPSDVVEAAKVAVRAHLLDKYQANRQFAVSTEAGIVRTSQPGEGRPFGLPEVDAVANRRSFVGTAGSVTIA